MQNKMSGSSLSKLPEKNRKAVFAIAIDQTVATGFIAPGGLKASIEHYRALGVTVPENVSSYQDLFCLPDVLRLHKVVEGAVEGVRRLSEVGNVLYYALGHRQDVYANVLIQSMTRQWLSEHDFPFPDQLLFCRSSFHLLNALYEATVTTQEPVILIDARWRQFLDAFNRLALQAPYRTGPFQRQLILVAFGKQKRHKLRTDLRVVAFAAWSSVTDLIADLKITARGDFFH